MGEKVRNFHIPNDLEREFPIAPHFVQLFGQYPNYIYFSDDFRPSVRDLLMSRGFTVINSSIRLNEKGWQTVEQVIMHPEGVLLKLELLADRFCRIHGYFKEEENAKVLLEDIYEHKYQHEDNQTHIYLIQSGLGGLHTERVEIEPPENRSGLTL